MPLIGASKVKRAIKKTKTIANDDLRAIYFKGLADMVKGTPVDEGETRNNFFLTVRGPSTATRGKNKSGGASLKSISSMSKKVTGKILYFTNNKPQAHVLEYGGYPVPVKKGTYNKKIKSFEIRSIEGFSKQAPKGWIRAVIIRMRNQIRAL